jgi:predicted metallo-beta-lactamase superfamily hydrolase
MSHVNPLPGTKLFEQCTRDKLFTQDEDASVLWRGGIAMKLNGPKEFFIKPYGMEIEKLQEYDEKIKGLIAQKNAAWEKHKKETGNFPIQIYYSAASEDA